MSTTTTPRCPNCDAMLTYTDKLCPYCGADVLYDRLTGKVFKREWEPVKTTYVRDVKQGEGLVEIEALEVSELGDMDEITYVMFDPPPPLIREPPKLSTPTSQKLLKLTGILSILYIVGMVLLQLLLR